MTEALVYHPKLSCRQGRPQLDKALGGSCWSLLSTFRRAATARISCGIEFLDFLQPTIVMFYMAPCHMSRWARSTFGRSSRCILFRRFCALTLSLVVTPHILRIIAPSLRFRRCKSDKAGSREMFQYNWRVPQMSLSGNPFSRMETTSWFYGNICVRNYITVQHQWCGAVI